MRELSIKQTLFIEYYIETRCGVKSAELAGYGGNNATLRAIASQNLAKPIIREAIEERLKSKILSSNQILAEISDVAFAPWREFVDVKYGDDGQVVSAQMLLKDKLKALELMGKYRKLFTDRVETEYTSPALDKAAESLVQLVQRLEGKQISVEEAKVIMAESFERAGVQSQMVN